MDKNDIVWPEPTIGSNAITDTAEVTNSPTEVAKDESVDRGGNSSQTISSTHKDTPSTQDSQDNKHENKETSSEDTVGGSPVALAYLLEGGVGSILNAGYFLHGVAAAYPPITNDIERIRASHGGLLGLPPLEFVENHPEVVEKIEKIILETYGQKGVEIYHKLCQNASGFYPRQGFEVGRDIESLEALQPHPETTEPTESERTEAPAKESAPKSEGSKQKSEKKGKTASKPKSEVKSEVKSDEAAPLTEDEFEEALNTDDIDKVTDALKLTRNAIELNSIDDIQEGDIVLITHMNAELLKKGETGTYVYKARKKLSRSYDLESVLADGSISITNEDIESIKRTPGGSLTIYRVKPELADRLKRGEEEKQRKLREENLKFEEEMRKKAEASAKRREKARAQEKANEERAEKLFDMAQEAENEEDFFKMASEIYQVTGFQADLRDIFNMVKNHELNSSREMSFYTRMLTPNEEQEAERSEDSPTSRKHKAEAEAQTATTEDTARRDALTDLMQQSGMEVFVDEKAQQVLDEENERVRLNAKQKRALETASISQKEEYQQTVVSSADGAKILKNLDKLAEEYDNSPYTKEKTFLGALAQALGASTKGSSSQYATFETINGQIVTIRLANHSASSKRMDDAGRDNAISIVISAKPNEGVTNDGDAHIVEFYYNSIKLRKAEGHPLAEIVRSIKQALYSGEYKDTTGLAEIQEVNTTFEKLREHRVFHGSGAEFDAFDHSHMGEGEGAQAYGWGTYVTEVEGIGRAYASTSGEVIAVKYVGNKNIPAILQGAIEHKMMETGSLSWCREDWRDMLDFCMENINEAKKENREPKLSHLSMANKLEELLAVTEDMKDDDFKMESKRFLYTVEIPEDNGTNYLHWEKPLTREQIVRITEKLKSGGWNVVDGNHPTFEKNGERIVLNERAQGRDVYAELEEALGSDKAASEFLSSVGFTGISYPAEYRSGGRNDGARNFVIFNESDAQITDHIRFFRTPGGEAYGFTVNGKIYLDPRIATAETAIHEYAHLWADMLRQMNPEAWNDIVQLMKGTSVWDEVKSLYPELKTEDEIADEVLAHYSGRRGAAKLSKEHHRIAHDQNMDLRSKATAIAALERIKQALTKFWKGVADLLHIRFTTAEEVADRVLADLLHGVNPNKYIKRKGKGVQKLHLNDKTLAGIHNITEENLRKALNLGGLANPSLAIIDTDQNKHEGFGEISLIAPSELVDKETGHTAGTWTTDAYTQRYPKVERVMSEAGYKKFDKWVESLDLTDSEKAEVRRQAKDSLENNSAPAWEMMYLREKGIDTNAYTSKAPYEWKQMLDTYDSVDELLEGMKLDEELQKKVINYVKAELSKPTKEKIREQLREQIKEETGTAPAILPPRYWKQVTEIFNRDYAKDLFGEDLMPGEEDVKKVMQQLFDLHNRTRQVDFGLSKSKASTYVHSHDLYSDYLRWQDKKLKEFGVKGRLFRGYSADGSRKYIPETLKNVSKAMVADAKGQTNGGEMVSLGSFVAKFADRVDSTDEMRANKKRLANNESKQGFYSEWMPTYNELADELSDDIFAGEQRLHDIAVQDNPVKYAKKEYGITLSKSFMDKLNAFKKAIREDMTSAYFETKFERPVYLNEFAAAVIPSDLSEDVKGGLEKSGIAIYEYDPKIEGDRDRATNAAFEADNRIRFQLVGEKGAAAIDKAESSNGAVLYREDSENSNHPYEVFTGNEAIEQLDGVLNDDTILLPDLPMPIRSLTEFQRVFAQPVRSAIGEYLNIKDDVYNKIIRENRSAISGALLPTIQNPDFVIRDVDGSNLYVKRFVSANSGNKYNIVAVNKHGEIEDYVSSVHVKRDNNIRNKIKNGAELLLPNERNTDGINIRNNSTPAANVIQSPNTSNTLQRENAENNAKSATEAPITQAANRTAGSLHLDNVTILGEQDLASLTPKQRSAKGWFDPKTGRIYINASNHANEADVVQTVLHEAVAHFGLRALFGKDFDTMLDQVYRAAGSALYDANINHLYVCEVFLASKIENGNTLQTAASQPHGGIALYKDILANVLDTANVAQSFDTSNTLQRKHARLMYPSSAKQLSRL